MGKTFLTRSRLYAGRPLHDGTVLTAEQLRQKVANAKGLPVVDAGQITQGSDQDAPEVGVILEATVNDAGELWLKYEVDLEKMLPGDVGLLLTGKAAAFAAFEYGDSRGDYRDMIYAVIYESEPGDRHGEDDPSFHRVIGEAI